VYGDTKRAVSAFWLLLFGRRARLRPGRGNSCILKSCGAQKRGFWGSCDAETLC